MFCPNCRSEYIEGVLECPDCNLSLIESLLTYKFNNTSPSHPSQYLNDLEEWNKNQYNPGYWAGGNIPPHIKVLSKAGNKNIGLVAIICGLIIFGFVINSLFTTDFDNSDQLLALIPGCVIGAFFGVLLIWAGTQRIKDFMASRNN